eukprot:9297-Heterococcus_DN1.PRE.2
MPHNSLLGVVLSKYPHGSCETVNKICQQKVKEEHDERLYPDLLMRSSKGRAPDQACAAGPALGRGAL